MHVEENKQKPTIIVSYLVFFATLAVIIPSFVSIIFPALIINLTSPLPEESVDPFEIGGSAFPVLTVGLILLGFGFLYYSGYLPNSIQSSIKFILNFEVSRKTSFFVLLILLTIYVGLSVEELAKQEEFGDIREVLEGLERFPLDNAGNLSLSYRPVNSFLLKSSEEIFQNYRIVPFLASISLIVLTYFFTVEITKKRFSGLISVSILLQSFLFLTFSSTVSYTNFWTLFYVLSLYLIIKKWQFSVLAYIGAILSKLLAVSFLPMTLFFTYRAKITKSQKIYAALSNFSIVAIIFIYKEIVNVESISIFFAKFSHFDRFFNGFSALAYQFRYDQFILVFLIPLVCGLFMISRKGNKYADAISFLILGSLLSAPLTALADVTIQPYRFIPFIVFFSIGVGMIFSQKITKQFN